MRRFQLTLTLCTIGLVINSQSVVAGNLLQTYHQALQYDAQYQSAILSYDSSLEVRNQSKAAFRPQVNASLSTSINDVNDDSNDSYDNNKFSLSINQALYNPANKIAIKQADLTVAQAQTDLKLAAQDLIFRAADAYFGVLKALDNLEFAHSEKNAIEQRKEQSDRRFEVGLIAITDVKEAQAALDQAIASEISAENTLSNAYEALRVMTGQPQAKVAILSDTTPLISPEPNNIEHWVKTAETSNLTLRIAEISAEIATQQIAASRTGHLPTIGAAAVYNKSSADSGNTKSDSGTLQLQLDLPIYSGGLTQSRVSQAKAQAKRAAMQYEFSKRITAQNTRNAFNGVTASISRVKAFNQALLSTKVASEATETGFEVGTRTAVDVLQALRDTYQAEANYSSARYDYILNSLKLKQATGTLSASDLESINQWLVSQ